MLCPAAFRLAEFLPKEYVKLKGIEKLIYQVHIFLFYVVILMSL